MKEFNSVNDVLDFAIEREQAGYERYHELANQACDGQTRDIFFGFAAEEATHRRKLEDVKAGTDSISAKKLVPDLNLSDHLPKTNLCPSMSFKEALIFATQWEKSTATLYSALAESISIPEVREVFEALALEEKEHKFRFESIYQEMFQEKEEEDGIFR